MRLGIPTFIVSTLLLGACSGDSTPTSPSTPPSPPSSPASPIGTWTGAFTDPVEGAGTARLSLAEQPAGGGGPFPAPQGALAGTWSVAFRSGASASGPASGVLISSAVYAFTLYPDAFPPCALGPGPSSGLLQYTLVNAVVTSTQFTGSLGRFTCAGISFGTMSLTRQ